jgi:hypothetical protein
MRQTTTRAGDAGVHVEAEVHDDLVPHQATFALPMTARGDGHRRGGFAR